MKKHNFTNSDMRPVLVMLLCTGIAFSAALSYAPASREAANSVNVTDSPETESAGDRMEEGMDTEEETARAEMQEQMPSSDEPTPYRLNFAYIYPEGDEKSYAQIFMEELIQKDSQWYASIYDMANMAPARVAARLGRSSGSVLGNYNPVSENQLESDPSTWAVEHFKNVRVSFYNGDGAITSAVSNAQDILSMASVYAYYNEIEDMDVIREYINNLWSASHSYSASMGEIYYCDGCVDPNQTAEEEYEDSELEGEDSFYSERTIDTEITDTNMEAGQETDADGELVLGGEASESTGEHQTETASEDSVSGNAANGGASSDHAGSLAESTTSALDSLAATAESVYMEETRPKVVIVRPDETEETTRAVLRPTESTEAGETKTGAAETEEAEKKEAEETGSGKSEAGEAGLEKEETTEGIRPTAPSITVEETVGESEGVESSKGVESSAGTDAGLGNGASGNAGAETGMETNAEVETEEETTRRAVIVRPDDTDGVSESNPGPSARINGTQFSDYYVHAASLGGEETKNSSKELICPGHIDLKITATIHTVSDTNGLYSLDSVGNAVDEGGEWTGWTSRNQDLVSHINRMDWAEAYGLSITMEGTRAPLSNAEIDSYLNMLPEGTSEERENIIRFALQSVGKVPYYWGGKAAAPNYSGNHFGSVTIPDYRGRILKGLDCSGWINWVYWSATGTSLPYEGTEGLKTLGRQVAREELQPGDLVLITGNTPHVIMFLTFTDNGQILCVHEAGSVGNVTVSVMTADWPYYRNILD